MQRAAFIDRTIARVWRWLAQFDLAYVVQEPSVSESGSAPAGVPARRLCVVALQF